MLFLLFFVVGIFQTSPSDSANGFEMYTRSAPPPPAPAAPIGYLILSRFFVRHPFPPCFPLHPVIEQLVPLNLDDADKAQVRGLVFPVLGILNHVLLLRSSCFFSRARNSI